MKKLLLVLGIVILTISIALLALVTLVDPNQFKPLLVEQVKKNTGLDLVVDGDIQWQFFPSLGFSLGKTELRNPDGFENQNLFKVDTIGIDVSVIPLLQKKLEIGNVNLSGAELHIETLKDGKRNIDVLSQKSSATEQQTVSSSAQSTAPQSDNVSSSKDGSGTGLSTDDWSINLAGITVSDTSVEIQDRKAGTYTKLYDVSFQLSEFAFDQWTKIDFAMKGQNNQQKFATQGRAEFKLQQDLVSYTLRDIELDASLSDPQTKIERAVIGLDTFAFGKANSLTYEVVGQASGLDLDLKGSSTLTIDPEMTKLLMGPLKLKATLQGASLPQSPMNIDMDSTLSFDITQKHLSFVLKKLAANDLLFDGKTDATLSDIPKIRFSLHSPNIDLDEFLGLSRTVNEPSHDEVAGETSTAPKSSQSQPKQSDEKEPDLSALKTLDVEGKIAIDAFKASNAHMQNVDSNFSIKEGIVKLSSFSSNLYQGSIKANARLDARQSPASYVVKKQLKGVKVQPLLRDVLENDKLEGTGNINVDISGKSLTVNGIKKNLAGTVSILFEDGAVNGINVAQLIRENYAKFKGKEVEKQNEPLKTDFSALQATLKLNKGTVSTNDLSIQSPLLRIHGEGKANYLQEDVDFLLRTSIVGSLSGQGGKDIDELRDITIPINISGKWADPKFKLVFDEVLKQKAQKEIDRGLKKLDEKLGDKIKDEKTKDAVNKLLKGLFN